MYIHILNQPNKDTEDSLVTMLHGINFYAKITFHSGTQYGFRIPTKRYKKTLNTTGIMQLNKPCIKVFY